MQINILGLQLVLACETLDDRQQIIVVAGVLICADAEVAVAAVGNDL